MLVLSRKEGQAFVVNGSITVTVSQIRGNVCRLAIDAPRHVPVVRQELTPYQRAESTDDAFVADGAMVNYGKSPVLMVAIAGAKAPIMWSRDAYCLNASQANVLAMQLAGILQGENQEPAHIDAGDLGEVGLRALAARQANIITAQAAEIDCLRAQIELLSSGPEVSSSEELAS